VDFAIALASDGPRKDRRNRKRSKNATLAR
jgi:hypothetical protein